MDPAPFRAPVLFVLVAAVVFAGCVSPSASDDGGFAKLMRLAEKVIGQAKNTSALEEDHGDQVRAAHLLLVPRDATDARGWGVDAILNGTDSLGRALRFTAHVVFALYGDACPRAEGLGDPLSSSETYVVPESFEGTAMAPAFRAPVDLTGAHPGGVYCVAASVTIEKSGTRLWFTSAATTLPPD